MNRPQDNEAPREPQTVPIHERLLWGISDVAALLGIDRRTVERLRSAGRFPQPDIKVGKRVLWRPATIREWVAKGGGA